MTEKPAYFKEEIKVRAYDCDFMDHWKPVCMLQSMQELANTHAASLGFGFDEMTAQNQAWVLSRIKIRYYEFPMNGDIITIQTFPRGVQQKIFFTRDFLLTNPAGKVMVAATTAWLVIDFTARRMLLPSALKGDLPIPPGLVGLDEPLEKIPLPENMTPLWTLPAAYSTIDVMGHVNNTRYIEWVSDCFPVEQYQSHKLDWIQINYTNEVKPGEQVLLSKAPAACDPQVWYVSGFNQNNNNRSFEAAAGWSPR